MFHSQLVFLFLRSSSPPPPTGSSIFIFILNFFPGELLNEEKPFFLKKIKGRQEWEPNPQGVQGKI
jgi:hypothetical protein